MAQLNHTIGFIGAGNMGEAFVGALTRSGIFSPSAITMSDVYQDRLELMKQSYGVQITSDNFKLFSTSDIVVLAIKPQQMAQVLSDIAGYPDYRISQRKLIISIAAGLTLIHI